MVKRYGAPIVKSVTPAPKQGVSGPTSTVKEASGLHPSTTGEPGRGYKRYTKVSLSK